MHIPHLLKRSNKKKSRLDRLPFRRNKSDWWGCLIISASSLRGLVGVNMPPRYPHGLKKPPTDMSGAEKFVFGFMAASITAGMVQLATSPWSEATEKEVNGGADKLWWEKSVKEMFISACPVKFGDDDKKGGSGLVSGNEKRAKIDSST